MLPDATHNAMNRRDFITGTASGVVGVVAMGAAVTAQAPQAAPTAQPAAAAGRVFYKAISGETVQMRGHKGDTIDAYLARPAGPGKYPGVVVVHHMPGWDEPTIEITRKFAQHGYAAICPESAFPRRQRDARGQLRERAAGRRNAG